MTAKQILAATAITSLFMLIFMAGSGLFFNRGVRAAPLLQATATPAVIETTVYVSVSAMDFEPANSGAGYNKDTMQQLLSLNSQTRNFTPNSNVFVASPNLPDRALLTGMTVFGVDSDNQGAVLIRLKRCNHGQLQCVTLVETTSTAAYAFGQFETQRITSLNEVIDHNNYAYFLELELTALPPSGLRSVRLEVARGQSSGVVSSEERWSLSGNMTSFQLPSVGLTEARICTDDLSALPNPTHYPYVVADGQVTPLTSNSCVTVRGRVIEIQRQLNTGASSGTYQFLR